MKRLALITGFGLFYFATLNGQETQRFSFEVGGGFTQPVGNTGRNLDEGWNVRGGAGYNFSKVFGVMLDADFNSMGINSATLNNLGFPGGDVHVFAATIDPIVHLTPGHHIDFYLTGGGGLFHRYQEFTQPSVSTFTGFNPFFGFYPVAVPTTQILSSYSINKPGIDVGGGIAIGTKWHGKFFAEARYERMFMSNYGHMDYLPISFGLRW